MTQVRVMLLDITSGHRGSAMRTLVRRVAPDVALVTQGSKSRRRSGRRGIDLARVWKMRYVGGGRKAGSNLIAVANGVVVRKVRTRSLKSAPWRPKRGAVSAQLRIHGQLIGVVVCHLSPAKERRANEVEQVVELVSQLRGPVIVAGNLNELPGGPAWQRLRQAGLVDEGTRAWKTFPSEQPTARVDALLTRGVRCVCHHGDPGVPVELQVEASDHRGILAVLEI